MQMHQTVACGCSDPVFSRLLHKTLVQRGKGDPACLPCEATALNEEVSIHSMHWIAFAAVQCSAAAPMPDMIEPKHSIKLSAADALR